MTKHLVSTLRKSEKIALKNEFLDRLRIAKTVLRESAEEDGVAVEDLAPNWVSAVVTGCLNGVGFAAEEVRGIRRPLPRSGPNADADE